MDRDECQSKMPQAEQWEDQPDSCRLTCEHYYYDMIHMRTRREKRRVWGTAGQRSMVIRRDEEHTRLHYRSDLALCEFLG